MAVVRQRRLVGFTLMELMVGMFVFTLLAVGVTMSVLQSRRLSQLNVLTSAAYSVAQGYMEQMMSINPADIESASEWWVSGRPALPTEAVNSLTTNASAVETSDPLYVSPLSSAPAGANMTARTDSGTNLLGTALTNDMWNNKQVMIDTIALTNGSVAPVNMSLQVDVQVSRQWTEVNSTWQIPVSPSQLTYFLIRIDFQYWSTGYVSVPILTGSVRMCRTDIPGP